MLDISTVTETSWIKRITVIMLRFCLLTGVKRCDSLHEFKNEGKKFLVNYARL